MKFRETRIYRLLTSTKTAVIVLLVLVLFFLIGTVFPQGASVEEYEKAKGTFLFAARYLGVLHIFSTPLFFAAALFLGLNTFFCTLERFRGILRKRGNPSPAGGTILREAEGFTADEITEILHKEGLRLRKKEEREGEIRLHFRRGPSLVGLSVLFHGLIVLSIGAFFHTYLFSYENYLSLGPGETADVTVPAEKEPLFTIRLDDFRTVYVDNPEITFPRAPLLRIASIISPDEETRFTLPEGAVSVDDWISRVTVLRKGEEVAQADVLVGRPLSYGGVKLYQMGYDQKITLRVGKEKLSVEPGKPFSVGKEKFVVSAARHGEWRRLDGTKGKVKPHVTLYRVTGKGRYDREKVTRLFKGKPEKVGKNRFLFQDFSEKSVFSYRVDPAVSFLSVAAFLINLLIFLRLVTTEERVTVTVKDGEAPRASAHTRGVFARRKSLDLSGLFSRR
ncbi:MAG: hypothetical protein D6713_07880 [Deltaproteobacteria bacterium]|nr:MAG: hypothetical protein D6713_07880 [Deltaproteobacteria bacterium]